MRLFAVALILAFGTPSLAEILVPARAIRAKEIIGAQDLVPKSADVPGAVSHADEVIGKEARVALYPGRPIRFSDIGPPAVVDRNDVVSLIFNRGGLTIIAEGRAMGRGATGEIIRVMNLTSRSTVTGRIRSDGSIEVH
ncbi:flagellar basal body P-ring formation chaperone FlgA [Tropicibacter sp. Alg240-R139]|uniref:flagellar basal body P-ring formation chaperone FlgA n=1 Tax=Tropicibacter sp. Alg240-R139 TaxID=2305991 RepID=UPI0013DEA7F5|nr:flagellar basal body P-ring formation chaperone FlgA [Tropicibacter sp. Alg240-R139]